MRSSVAVVVFGLAAVLAAPALAEPWETNRALGALPGFHRVAGAEPVARDVAIFAGAGYGFAGSVIATDDTHHRATGALAAAVGIRSWLGLGIRLDGRYDRHSGVGGAEGDEVDDGLVGDPRLYARLRGQLTEEINLAGQLTMWLPGSNAPSLVASAASFDFLAAASYQPVGRPWRVGANLGFRLDNSAESADSAAMLSQPDRLSLGVSDANALLLGLGAAYRVGPAELVGEWTWDLLVGDGAPSVRTSPMRFAAGLRAQLGSTMTAQLIVETNAAKHPAVEPTSPLAPFEPRVSVSAGLFYRFGDDDRAKGPLLPAEPDAEPEPPKPSVIIGQVVDDTGEAIADAAITVTAGETTREAVSDPEGRFRIAGLSGESASVTVDKDGYNPRDETVAMTPGAESELSIQLDPILPPGQIRGAVLSYRGKPVKATLIVEPLGLEVENDADGSFQIDVPPGDYEVVVKAPGYREQRRPVQVVEGGVFILNIDFERKKKRK